VKRDNKDLTDRITALEAKLAQAQAAATPPTAGGLAPAPGDQGGGAWPAPRPRPAGSGAAERLQPTPHDLLLSGGLWPGLKPGSRTISPGFGDGPRGPGGPLLAGPRPLSARSGLFGRPAGGAYIAAPSAAGPRPAGRPTAGGWNLSRSLIQIKEVRGRLPGDLGPSSPSAIPRPRPPVMRPAAARRPARRAEVRGLTGPGRGGPRPPASPPRLRPPLAVAPLRGRRLSVAPDPDGRGLARAHGPPPVAASPSIIASTRRAATGPRLALAWPNASARRSRS